MIDKGIEMPLANKYAAISEKMEIGDSVFFEGAKDGRYGPPQAIQKYFLRRGLKTSYRKVDGGVRVWRVT